jgi:membrane-associated phospholipid phosphatase
MQLAAAGAAARRDDLLYRFWFFVTDFGDSAVTLPLAALTLLYLLLSHWPRTAAALAISLAASGAAIAALKLALQSCGQRLLETTVINPSGHVVLSTMIYGALALLLGGALPRGWRWALYVPVGLLVAAIAVSRLVLHTHNLGEMLTGLAVGLGALALFHHLRGESAPGQLRVSRLALSAFLLMVAMHGTRWPIEEEIRDMVALIRAGVPQCATAREPVNQRNSLT